MSSHFSANQYELAFSPQRLQNYEVPFSHKPHPSMRSGRTQIISNDRGHLNPNVPRSPASPWGSFVGTWQTERRPIQLRTRTKLLSQLSQIDQRAGSSSKHSSRASSTQVSQREEQTTSPRPQSALKSEQGGQESQQVAPDSHLKTENQSAAGSKPATPATGTNSKPPTPTTEAGSKPPTPATGTNSKPPTPATGTNSQPPTPAPGSPTVPVQPARAVSAASSRSSVSRSCTPASTNPSRAQSASVARTTPHPLHQPRVSSGLSSRGGEGTHTPLSSIRVSSPRTPSTTHLEPDGTTS